MTSVMQFGDHSVNIGQFLKDHLLSFLSLHQSLVDDPPNPTSQLPVIVFYNFPNVCPDPSDRGGQNIPNHYSCGNGSPAG